MIRIGLIDIETSGSNIIDKIYIKEPLIFELNTEELDSLDSLF